MAHTSFADEATSYGKVSGKSVKDVEKLAGKSETDKL